MKISHGKYIQYWDTAYGKESREFQNKTDFAMNVVAGCSGCMNDQ
jgi:hypothetical protein